MQRRCEARENASKQKAIRLRTLRQCIQRTLHAKRTSSLCPLQRQKVQLWEMWKDFQSEERADPPRAGAQRDTTSQVPDLRPGVQTSFTSSAPPDDQPSRSREGHSSVLGGHRTDRWRVQVPASWWTGVLVRGEGSWSKNNRCHLGQRRPGRRHHP